MTFVPSWSVVSRQLGDPRTAWIVVFALVGIYFAGLFAFYPRTYTNTDEAQYVRQSRLLLEGATFDIKTDPLTGEQVEDLPSTYPLGTALYIAPFIWLGGPEGAFVAPCVALALAVLFTACWLREEGHSPLYALLVLGFVPALVLGRVPLSGLPSAAYLALGLWLFFRGIEREWPWWIASGFIAGSSIVLREPNVLVLAPFFAGTVLRRETKCWALIVGGLAGLSMRLLAADFVFGDPFFVKPGYYFAPHTLFEKLPYYTLGLLVLVPGGLAAGLSYRGRRWPELVTTVSFFTLFYLTQKHTASPSGLGRATVIALRYFLPLIPVLAFAVAEVLPRTWRWLRDSRTPRIRERLESLAAVALLAWIAGIAGASIGVHWTLQRWSASQADIREAIYEAIGDDSVLVTNWPSTRKFLRRLDRQYLPVDRSAMRDGDSELLLDRHGEFYVAFLDRSDSQYWRDDAIDNAAFIDSLELPHVLEVDRRPTATDRLRVWRVGSAR